jgi:SAM-dependent methyltransferase
MLNRFRAFLAEVPDGGSYLDLGCGDGQLLEAVKRVRPNIQVHGLDWKFVPSLRERLESSGIILHESTLERAALPTRHFDLITMNQLIEHVWDPRSCLSTIERSLSGSGKLLIATPNADGYDRRFFRRTSWGGYYFPRHLNLFNKSSLATLVAQSGMSVVKCENLLAPVVWCYSLKASALLRFPKSEWLHRFFDLQNVSLLAFFAGLDAIAIAAGAETSNQMLIARSKFDLPPRARATRRCD